MDVKDLGALALTLAVAGIIISFTLLVQSELNEEMCPDGSTYVILTGEHGNQTVHPSTNMFAGCCDGNNGTYCFGWTWDAASNASASAIEGVAEFSNWFVIIALALVFAIILGIIVKYIGGAGGQA